MKLCFLDTETTSLDADTGEIWEVGMITRDTGENGATETEDHWFLPVTLEHADPISLDIGRYHERHPQGNAYDGTTKTPLPGGCEFAHGFAGLTHNAHLAGNVVSFDADRLRKLLRAYGVMPSWHYHLVDVEALVAGRLGLAPPWNSRDLSAAIGVEMPTDEERHTALGDAYWAMRLYDAAMEGDKTDG